MVTFRPKGNIWYFLIYHVLLICLCLVCFVFTCILKLKELTKVFGYCLRCYRGLWSTVLCLTVSIWPLLSFITGSVTFPWRASKTCWYNSGKRVLKEHGCIPIPNINVSFFLNVLAWNSRDCWSKDICLCSLWNSWVIVIDLWTLLVVLSVITLNSLCHATWYMGEIKHDELRVNQIQIQKQI